MKIKTVSYVYKDDVDQIQNNMVLLQEQLQEIYPSLVYTNDDEGESRSVRYMNMVALLLGNSTFESTCRSARRKMVYLLDY